MIDPLAHQGLVHSIARRFCGRGLDMDDLIGEGQIGLLRACELYDPSRGAAFATYATYWIRQAILGALDDKGRLVRIPRYLRRDLAHADEASLSPKRRERVEAARNAIRATRMDCEEYPLDSFVEQRGGGGDNLEFDEDVLPRLALLPERQRQVLDLRYGFTEAGPMTLDEVGQRLNLCRERVRQIERDALARLRGELVGIAG